MMEIKSCNQMSPPGKPCHVLLLVLIPCWEFGRLSICVIFFHESGGTIRLSARDQDLTAYAADIPRTRENLHSPAQKRSTKPNLQKPPPFSLDGFLTPTPSNMTSESCPPLTICSPTYSFPPFQMPTSKTSIRQRDALLRSQVSRELILATLKDPKSWDPCWRPLLLIQVVLKQYPLIDSLHDHPYIYERWWTSDTNGVNMKVLLTNEDGTSMVLLGTSAWDAEDSLAARWVCSIAVGPFLYTRARFPCSYSGFSMTA